ncbi:hypothetical protein B0H14DRAFT_3493811 [Mycena olivaceomarginata]|nr:hypothetical protein B0H14DRAFT_3493811 [Mycena olivaceomarginata]
MHVVELVELCLSHLNSPGDLKSCTLVCRLPSPKTHGITSSSPTHLVLHIRTLQWLHIRTQVTQETLSAICAFPFMWVTSIVLACSGVLPTFAVPALQALLVLPTPTWGCNQHHRVIPVCQSVDLSHLDNLGLQPTS